MKDDGFDAEAHLDAVAPTMGLAITDSQRPGVLTFLEIAHTMAKTLADAPLPKDVLELAPVFRPDAGEPR